MITNSIDTATFALFSQKPEPLGERYRRFMCGDAMGAAEMAELMEMTQKTWVGDLCRVRDQHLAARVAHG